MNGHLKRCPRCGETKDREEFNRSETRRDGRQGWCRPCSLEYWQNGYSAQQGNLALRPGQVVVNLSADHYDLVERMAGEGHSLSGYLSRYLAQRIEAVRRRD